MKPGYFPFASKQELTHIVFAGPLKLSQTYATYHQLFLGNLGVEMMGLPGWKLALG